MEVKNYQIELDFDLEKKIYEGKEKIFLNLDKEDLIKIDSVDLKIKELKVNDKEVNFEIAQDKILIKNGFQKGENIIFINFEGELKEVLGGIYLSKYKDKEEEKYLITTQFEPIEARKAFPCFDDPDKKATFDLTLIFPKELKAISNTLPIKEEILGEKKKVIFETSPKMSTYLLYIGIGDFYFLEDKYKDVLIRVAFTPKEKLEGAKFALENCKKFLSYLEEYFNVPYPLKKLDLIAIPDFAAGAMENWGAITFRENLLLVFEGITPQVSQRKNLRSHCP
jgi:tricorn protease interacting factor F2/3